MEEAIFYNALAKKAMGNYAALAKLKRMYATWKAAFRSFHAGSAGPGPETEFEKLRQKDIRLIMLDDPCYPQLLREIPKPPFGLYAIGDLPAIATALHPFAIVGTRRATPEGIRTAKLFAEALARAGFAIMSGLALGIDAAAHEGCLAGGGITAAVLAGGLDGVYPGSNRRLAERITQNGGTLLSEYPPGEPSLPYRFVERNRIISGLARGVLIVEAPERSGSLTTAGFALEQNRDVFAVPGNIQHPNFKGSHALIRAGAELVAAPQEILAAYGIPHEERIASSRETADLSPEEVLVLRALRAASIATHIDKIIELTKLEPRIVTQATSFLLLKHLIREADDGYIIIE